MGSLGRLLVLALAVTGVAAQRGSGGGRRPGGSGGRRSGPPQPSGGKLGPLGASQPPLNITDMWEKARELGCLPGDATALVFSSCDDQQQNGGLFEKLECVINSTNIVGDSGYEHEAAEAFVVSISSDEQWTGEQIGLLSICKDMMSKTKSKMPDNQQGVFMLACWYKLMVFECNTERVASVLEDVSPGVGGLVARAVANLAEGSCIWLGLKSRAGEKAFMKCANESEVDLGVVFGAIQYYKNYTMDNDFPAPPAENITIVGEQLLKFKDAVFCAMEAKLEIEEDGEIDYEQINDNFDNSRGPEWLKTTAKAVSDYCKEQNPQTADQYYTCSLNSQPYACTSVAAHVLAMSNGKKMSGEEGGRCGAGRRGTKRRGGKRGRGGGRNRRRNRGRQQQQQG